MEKSVEIEKKDEWRACNQVPYPSNSAGRVLQDDQENRVEIQQPPAENHTECGVFDLVTAKERVVISWQLLEWNIVVVPLQT